MKYLSKEDFKNIVELRLEINTLLYFLEFKGSIRKNKKILKKRLNPLKNGNHNN